MNPFRVFVSVLVILCLLCAHSSMAKPTGSMTRIQEVFRTLMGAKPMMLASRGKKSLVGMPTNVREFFQQDSDGTDEDADMQQPSSYWIVADERLPVVAVRLNER